MKNYESQDYLDPYLLFHYGRPRDLCPVPFIPREALEFHRRLIDQCLLPLRFEEPTRGLDIGCAVGRLTFELARRLDRVVGIDNSTTFIAAAQRMATARTVPVRVKEFGARIRRRSLVLPRDLRRCQVEFRMGDAESPSLSAMPPAHVVAAINVICRISHPRRFLELLERLVLPGGQLILASPFSWLEEYTPRREWLSPEEVARLLHPFFRLARRRELPFLIREHRRKYDLVISQVSTFIRRTAAGSQNALETQGEKP